MNNLSRLSEDLRTERQKASAALQDRARLRVEIEGLRQKIQLQVTQLEQVNNVLEERGESLHNAEQKIKELERNTESSLQLQYETNEKLSELEEKNQQLRNEKHALNIEIEHVISESEELNNKLKEYELQLDTKNKSIDDHRKQIDKLEKTLEEIEERNFYLIDQNREKALSIDELKEKANNSEALENANIYLNQTCDDIKSQLDVAYDKNTKLEIALRDETRKLNEKNTEYDVIKHKLNTITIDRDRLKVEALDWEKAHDNLSSRIHAENESAEYARHKSDTALKEINSLQIQLNELNTVYETKCNENEELNNEIANNKIKVNNIHQENFTLNEKLLSMNKLENDNDNLQIENNELKNIKELYMDLRKQVIRRDMEDGVNELATTMSKDHNVNVHEEIIEDLRKELTIMHDNNANISTELDKALKKCYNLDKLEEDMQLLRETTQIITAERNSAILTASEATERAMKTIHNRDLLVRDVHRAESDMITAKNDIVKLKDELALERQKYRQLHVEKLGCERAAAECVAVNARAEANFEEEKEKYTITNIELERSKRSIKEQNLVINKLREQMKALVQEQAKYYGSSSTSRAVNENNNMAVSMNERSNMHKSPEKGSLSSLSSSLSPTRSPHVMLSESNRINNHNILTTSINENIEIENMKNEISQLEHGKAIMAKEIETLKKSVMIQRDGFDKALAETLRLHEINTQLRKELTEFNNNLYSVSVSSSGENLNDNEKVVRRLRTELDETLSKWTKIDNESTQKNQLIVHLQGELSREKEKGELLRTQVGALDDRLNIAMGELTSNNHMNESEKQKTRALLIKRLTTTTTHNNNNKMSNYSNLHYSESETKSNDTDTDGEIGEEDRGGGYNDLSHSRSSSKQLRISDFQATPVGKYSHESNANANASASTCGGERKPSSSATFGHFRLSERREILSQGDQLLKKQHSINIETSLSTNEQLKRRRERREKQRNLALKGEAFYSASHGMTILPAKLDFQQARQLLASKSGSSSKYFQHSHEF